MATSISNPSNTARHEHPLVCLYRNSRNSNPPIWNLRQVPDSKVETPAYLSGPYRLFPHLLARIRHRHRLIIHSFSLCVECIKSNRPAYSWGGRRAKPPRGPLDNVMGHRLSDPECRRSRQGGDGIGIPDAKAAKPSGRLGEICVTGYQ